MVSIKRISANCTEVGIRKNASVLFSYDTCVAAGIDGKYYKTDFYHSRTTSKHINQWLNGIVAIEKPQEFFDNLVS